MRMRPLTSGAVLAIVMAVAGAPSARAADPIFNQGVLHEFRIVMDPADWASLRANFRSNQYYAANISVDGEVLQQVGVRSRGKGSRDATKPGLLIDTNKYVTNQEFHGLKKLVLDNVIQDSSFLHEPLAYQVFEAMGIASPAISYTRLTVNDEFWGVYWLIENIDKNFLAARFGGDKEGNLFKYEYVENYTFTDKGSDPNSYLRPLPAGDARGQAGRDRPHAVRPGRQRRAGGSGDGDRGRPLHRRGQVPDLRRGGERDRGPGRLRGPRGDEQLLHLPVHRPDEVRGHPLGPGHELRERHLARPPAPGHQRAHAEADRRPGQEAVLPVAGQGGGGGGGQSRLPAARSSRRITR